MRSFTRMLLIGLLAGPALLSAQGPQPQPPQQDPFARFLFPPELIMSNQQALGLQDAQRARIMTELQGTQNALMDVQMHMGAETEKMAQLLGEATVDEAAVLAQVDRILELERQIKKRQVALLIRIRNVLTPQQRTKLSELRAMMR